MPGLPDDWKRPEWVQYARAWDDHPDVELLNERKAERNEKGMPRWVVRREPVVDHPDWVAMWQRPSEFSDPRTTRDPRPDILITTYPQSWADQQNLDAQAIADEHADD